MSLFRHERFVDPFREHPYNFVSKQIIGFDKKHQTALYTKLISFHHYYLDLHIIMFKNLSIFFLYHTVLIS